jgi:hypothetical protein
VSGAGHVRLLGVVGLALCERPARLRGQQEDLGRTVGEKVLQVRSPADVGGLDARPALLEAVQLLTPGRVPVVGQGDPQPGVERQLRQLRPDVPGPQNEEGARLKSA